jgi:hypothetical protein
VEEDMTTDVLEQRPGRSFVQPVPPPAVHYGPTWERNPRWDGVDPMDEFLLPELTLGWQAIAWVQANLLAEETDEHGQQLPFNLTFEQRRFILWFYAIDENGRFTYRNCVLQRLKGWGKDPLAAVICAIEFLGPCVFAGWSTRNIPERGIEYAGPVGKEHPRAWIQIAAVSKTQTMNTMLLFKGLFREELKAAHGIGKHQMGAFQITAHGGNRRIQAVTSSPKSLEGGRTTLVVMNEALALDTPIPTPDGWTTMGDLKVGDVIFGSDGTPTMVIGAHETQVDRRCFEVAFRDGTSIVASDGHLWQTRVAESNAKPRIRTTLEMFEDGRRLMVPTPGPRETPDIALPVEPYLLGAWLGDGSSGQPNVTAGDQDVDALREQLERRGTVTHLLATQDGKAKRISFSNQCGFGANMGTDVAKALRALPCYRDKYIPEEYLHAGTEQRMELLRGLMDTDGCMSRQGSAIFVGRERLARDVVELLRSLGQSARTNFAPDPRSREGGTWRVSFRPRHGLIPFALPRKVALVPKRSQRNDWEAIAEIREVDSVPVRCISVDAADRLFQAGEGGHVTHNTHHWVTANAGHEMYRVLDDNITKAKGAGARVLAITNAYNPADSSVAQTMREAWEDESAGLAFGTGVMYDSLEADPKTVLRPDLPDELDADEQEEAVREYLRLVFEGVRGDAVWLDIQNMTDKVLRRSTKPSDARRFWFNQVRGAEDAWILAEAVDAAEDLVVKASRARASDPNDVRIGWIATKQEPVVGFFDGSKSDDSTALVLTRVSDGYTFVGGVWEKPRGEGMSTKAWLAPRGDVEARVDELFERFNIVAFWGDPSHAEDEDGSRYWTPMLDRIHQKYRTRLKWWAQKSGDHQHSVIWDMASPVRTAEHASAAMVVVEQLERREGGEEDGPFWPAFFHDGHPKLKRHMKNARRNPLGKNLVGMTKEGRESLKKIDLGVALVGAQMLRTIVLNGPQDEKPKGKQPGRIW